MAPIVASALTPDIVLTGFAIVLIVSFYFYISFLSFRFRHEKKERKEQEAAREFSKPKSRFLRL